MGNYVMSVDFFGNTVRCETEGLMVSLNDLVLAGNSWRANNGSPLKKLVDVTQSKSFEQFLTSASKIKNMPKEQLFRVVGKGRNARTMANITVAVYVAEQMSPDFHVKVIDTFIENKLLEYRELGGTEFKSLNAAIDQYLPEREGKDNRGVYIQTAKALREKILGENAVTSDWNKASNWQTHTRYELEKELVRFLQMGFIKNYEHLKETIAKL